MAFGEFSPEGRLRSSVPFGIYSVRVNLEKPGASAVRDE